MSVPSQTPISDEEFARVLNELLVDTFHSIERYEERSLHSLAGASLSVNEAHVVEAVGRGCAANPAGITVSQVADALSVRVPTATAAVNRLVAKGLLTKARGTQDGRAVYVSLTREGRRFFRLHALFHRRMVDAVAGEMSPEERTALASGIRKLKAFFKKAVDEAAEDAPFGQNDACGTPSCAPADRPAPSGTPHGSNELED